MNCVFPHPPGNRALQGAARLRSNLGLFFERLNVSVQKLENAIEFYALFRITNCTACQCRLKPITSITGGGGRLCQRRDHPVFLRRTQDENGFNIYILDESNRVEGITTAKAAKRSWCVTSVASTVFARPFHLRLKLHQLQPAAVYQIVKVDGREQVIPFRTKSTVTCHLPIRSMTRRCCSSIFLMLMPESEAYPALALNEN